MDAVTIKNSVLCVCAAAGSFIANALGGWDSALKVLVAMMVAELHNGCACCSDMASFQQDGQRHFIV